jgi:hypothetical protein
VGGGATVAVTATLTWQVWFVSAGIARSRTWYVPAGRVLEPL